MPPSPSPKTIRRILFLLLLILLTIAWAPQAALAQAIIRGDEIPAGEVVDNDVILSGNVVLLAGGVNGNAFFAGRGVVMDGH